MVSCQNRVESKKLALRDQPEIVNEIRYCYATKIFQSNSQTMIEVDYVDYLTGKQAADAAIKNKDYYVDEDGDTLTYILDDYYISNIDNKLRTFQLADTVEIEIFFFDESTNNGIIEYKGNDISKLEKHLLNNPLLLITVKNNYVTKIKEQWIP